MGTVRSGEKKHPIMGDIISIAIRAGWSVDGEIRNQGINSWFQGHQKSWDFDQIRQIPNIEWMCQLAPLGIWKNKIVENAWLASNGSGIKYFLFKWSTPYISVGSNSVCIYMCKYGKASPLVVQHQVYQQTKHQHQHQQQHQQWNCLRLMSSSQFVTNTSGH